jgi:hypothetical protein
MKTTNAQNMLPQGIEGYIYRISGNQMPSPDAKPSSPKGMKTILYIYQLTNLNQVQRQAQSPFYFSIRTKFITKVETDSNGYFKINLAPGRYSLFTKKDELFFANWFDKDNNIAPTEVLPGKFVKVEFRVDYDAVY